MIGYENMCGGDFNRPGRLPNAFVGYALHTFFEICRFTMNLGRYALRTLQLFQIQFYRPILGSFVGYASHTFFNIRQSITNPRRYALHTLQL
jgi:hypothetical protein